MEVEITECAKKALNLWRDQELSKRIYHEVHGRWIAV